MRCSLIFQAVLLLIAVSFVVSGCTLWHNGKARAQGTTLDIIDGLDRHNQDARFAILWYLSGFHLSRNDIWRRHASARSPQTKILTNYYSCIRPSSTIYRSHILWVPLQIYCHPGRTSLGVQLCPECHCCSSWHLAACSSKEVYTMVEHLHTAHTRPLSNGLLYQPSTYTIAEAGYGRRG